MNDGYERLLTVGAQAWLGSVAGLARIQEDVFRAVVEPAYVEDDAVSEPLSRRVSVLVTQATRVGCTPLEHATSGTTIQPTDIGVFPQEVPAGTPTEVTFTVRPGLTLPEGVYHGQVTDGTGTPLTAPDSNDAKHTYFPIHVEVAPAATERPA